MQIDDRSSQTFEPQEPRGEWGGGCNRALLFCVFLCHWHCEGTTDKTLVMFNVTIYLSTSESGDHKGSTSVFTL